MDNGYFKEKVEAIKVNKKSISQLLEDMKKTGFQGRKLAEAAENWEKMIKDPDLTIVMGYAGSLSTTGQWKIVNWLIENRYIDALVSTGANISEDIVEAMGYSYWKGTHATDDAALFTAGINRYYDVYGKEPDYMKMTEMIAEFIMTLKSNHPYSTREFLYLFGKWLGEKGIESIVATAAKHGVPVFCPAIADSPYGDAALIAKSKGFNLILDAVGEYTDLMKISGKTKDVGVIYIGGGVPKDFIQLLAVTADLMYKDREVPGRTSKSREGTDETYYPHKYAIQLTTDSPQWGGLSGCTFEEATSWGKETMEGRNVACYGDATISLPIIVHALAERIGTKRKGVDFSSIFQK